MGGFWAEAGYQREMDSPNSDLLVITRGMNREVLGVGCLWSILEEAHITLLVVRADRQRQGLGQALLGVLLGCACQRGLAWATLEVRCGNSPALALYRKFGFGSVGRRPHYYQNPQEDALILWQPKLQSSDFWALRQLLVEEAKNRLAVGGWQLDLGSFASPCPDQP